jgi:DNA polymerase-3 subunit gamma/tau
MALALYRKYRPKTFGELVGQESVAELLINAARTGRIGHAYIFYGPRGTGKTTVARLLAKAANCLDRARVAGAGEPCGSCGACMDIDRGASFDVVEIDAASNRGIDEMRDLKESIRVAPVVSGRKIFIIDEAHMLTAPAWNALLKTLEEPPERAMIVLATTEFEKIPATIASRAQRFRFRRIPLRAIVEKLRRMRDAEGIRATDGALELIAAKAEGGLRDAESLLEQIASFADEVTEAAVEEIAGASAARRVAAFARALAAKDVSAALGHINELNAAGANIADFTGDTLAYLRRALALAADPPLERALADEVTAEDLRALADLSRQLQIPAAVALLKSLIRAYADMRYSPFPHIPLEVAVIEHCKT